MRKNIKEGERGKCDICRRVRVIVHIDRSATGEDARYCASCEQSHSAGCQDIIYSDSMSESGESGEGND